MTDIKTLNGKIDDFKNLDTLNAYKELCHSLLDLCQAEINELKMKMDIASSMVNDLIIDVETNPKTKEDLKVLFNKISNNNIIVRSDEEQ